MCFVCNLQLEKVYLVGVSTQVNISNIDFSIRLYEFVTPTVNADAGTQPNASTVDGDTMSSSASDDESSSDDQQVKKKPKREKVGFRDRKVCFQKLF